MLIMPAHGVYSAEIRDIAFPVDGHVSFTDTFGEARSGGRTHEGIDMLGEKMMPLLAAVDGRVVFAPMEERSWGYGIWIRDNEGYQYVYLHINNDTPGTDDGNGGAEHAYAPGIYEGATVTRGQLIGWMGDSGNAENVGAHLHFEIRTPQDVAIDAYPSLIQASSAVSFDPETTRDATPTINDDKQLPANVSANCKSGSLIKSNEVSAVYYCGANGKRYVFPHEKVYFSWYDDFSDVITVTAEELASVPLGGNVTYRPGVRMIKIQTDTKVYVVDQGGQLRWVASAEIAEALYGPEWAKQIDDISPAFFVNYQIGDPIIFAQ